jgi:hypothetical protein
MLTSERYLEGLSAMSYLKENNLLNQVMMINFAAFSHKIYFIRAIPFMRWF